MDPGRPNRPSVESPARRLLFPTTDSFLTRFNTKCLETDEATVVGKVGCRTVARSAWKFGIAGIRKFVREVLLSSDRFALRTAGSVHPGGTSTGKIVAL